MAMDDSRKEWIPTVYAGTGIMLILFSLWLYGLRSEWPALILFCFPERIGERDLAPVMVGWTLYLSGIWLSLRSFWWSRRGGRTGLVYAASVLALLLSLAALAGLLFLPRLIRN